MKEPLWKNLPPEEEISNYFGFVYKITHPETGKYYIGKKQFYRNVKLPPTKKIKRNRRVSKESDWKTYWGSSRELLAFIEEKGIATFEREIIHLTTCKWESSYLEAVEQIKHNVLLDDKSFNGILNLRINKVPKALRDKYILNK